MRARHVALAVLVTAAWGFSFVAIRVGLETFPPLFLVALRFAVAALPAVLLPRPPIPWARLAAIGATLFAGNFGFLFSGMAVGMPAGLASIVMQVQAFFTLAIVALVWRRAPARPQLAGMALAFAGLAVIGTTVGGDVTGPGLGLTLLGALSWAAGNVLLKEAGPADMLPLMAWVSLLPTAAMLGLSLGVEGPAAIGQALAAVPAGAVAAVLYLGIAATLVAFGLWGYLLRLYPATVVAPFSLLVPITGSLSAALVLGERFPPLRIAGMALIVAGLAAVAFPTDRLRRWQGGD